MGNKLSTVNWCSAPEWRDSKCWPERNSNGDARLAPALSNANIGSDVVGKYNVEQLL